MSIAKEVEKLQDKKDYLKDLYLKNGELKTEIDKLGDEMFRIYGLLFKNFVSKKIDTKIELDDDNNYSKKIVCLNCDGFSERGTYHINSSYIYSFKTLQKICKHYNKIVEHLKKKDKQRLVKEFSREINKLKMNDCETELILKKEKLKSIKGKYDEEVIINRIVYDGRMKFYKAEDTNHYPIEELSLGSNYSLFQYILLENFYPKMKSLIEKSNKKFVKARAERQALLERLKNKYSRELILAELSKEE